MAAGDGTGSHPSPAALGGTSEGASGGAAGQPRSLGLQLAQVGRAVGRAWRDALAPVGLEPRQYLLLAALAAGAGCTQQSVGASLQIPPSRMVALVDGLEERGLVERVAQPADRRAYALRLTDDGREMLARARPIVDAHEAQLSSALTGEQQALLVDLLGRLSVRRDDAGAAPRRSRRGHHG